MIINKIYVYGNDAHGVSVYNSFVQAFTDNSLSWTGSVIYGSATIAEASASGCQFYIKSYTGMSSLIATALLSYPDIQTIMPAGSNTPGDHIYDSGGNLPNIIVTGAGDNANETGYDVEFFSNDPITLETTPTDEQDLSSFSNGYIAGQLACIINTLQCSVWEARYRSRMTSSLSGNWVNTNGYGKINVASAIAYTGSISYDPYSYSFGIIDSLSSNKLNKTSYEITIPNIEFAESYQLYKDSVLYNTYSSTTSVVESITSSNNYKYKVSNSATSSDFSETLSLSAEFGYDIGEVTFYSGDSQYDLGAYDISLYDIIQDYLIKCGDVINAERYEIYQNNNLLSNYIAKAVTKIEGWYKYITYDSSSASKESYLYLLIEPESDNVVRRIVNKIKEKFKLIAETPVLILVKFKDCDISCFKTGKLLIKGCEDKEKAEKIVKEFYSIFD